MALINHNSSNRAPSGPTLFVLSHMLFPVLFCAPANLFQMPNFSKTRPQTNSCGVQLVQQPHMSDNSSESLSKSPTAVVVGVPDSPLSTFGWPHQGPLKKPASSATATDTPVMHHDLRFNGPSSPTEIPTQPSILSQSTGSSSSASHGGGADHDRGSLQWQPGSFGAQSCPLRPVHWSQRMRLGMHTQHIEHDAAHASPSPSASPDSSQSESVEGAHCAQHAVGRAQQATCNRKEASASSPEADEHSSGLSSRCDVDPCTLQLQSCTASDEVTIKWAPHPNTVAAHSHSPEASGSHDVCSTMTSGTSAVSNDAASGLERVAAAAHSSTLSQSSTPAVKMHFGQQEPRNSVVEKPLATEAHGATKPWHIDRELAPEQSTVSTTASVGLSACGLASENSISDLGTELSMEMEAFRNSLGPEAASEDLCAEFSAPDLCQADACEAINERACVLSNPQGDLPPLSFAFPQEEAGGQPLHQLPTPRMNVPISEQLAAAKCNNISAQQCGADGVPGAISPSRLSVIIEIYHDASHWSVCCEC
jgi:hypothetical protein